MRSNCLIFAVLLWWAWRRRGRTYLMLRMSDRGSFPHFLVGRYSEETGMVRVVSRQPPENAPEVKCPPLCHQGGAVFGDRPPV